MNTAVTARLLTQEESAHYLGVSLRTFQKHVAILYKPVRMGACVLFDRKDLDSWVDQQKGGPSSGSKPGLAESLPSDSDSTASVSSAPRGKRNLQRLLRVPKQSTHQR